MDLRTWPGSLDTTTVSADEGSSSPSPGAYPIVLRSIPESRIQLDLALRWRFALYLVQGYNTGDARIAWRSRFSILSLPSLGKIWYSPAMSSTAAIRVHWWESGAMSSLHRHSGNDRDREFRATLSPSGHGLARHGPDPARPSMAASHRDRTRGVRVLRPVESCARRHPSPRSMKWRPLTYPILAGSSNGLPERVPEPTRFMCVLGQDPFGPLLDAALSNT